MKRFLIFVSVLSIVFCQNSESSEQSGNDEGEGNEPLGIFNFKPIEKNVHVIFS